MVRSRLAASAALAVTLAASILGGCSGDQLLSIGNSSLETAAAGGTASAYGETKADTGTPANPLDPSSGGASNGPREVIANPTAAEIMMTGKLPEMAWGKADAPVTVVKYMSLTCRYCRQFHLEVFPELKKKYIDTGKVRFILREFPIGRTSGNATIALRCAKPEKYLDLYGKFLSQQEKWVSQEVRPDAIFAIAQQSGLKRPEFDACLKDQALIDGLKWVKDRGRTLGVIGTPNFFVAGKLVKRVLTYPDISAMIDAALVGQTAAVRTTGQ